MATRNEVLTLFGATPEQIREKQMRQQAATLQQMRDPYQQTGTAIGMALGRAFSGPTNEEQMAQQMQEALQGIDPNDPKQLREVAQAVAAFDPNRALQISNYAMQLEKSQRPNVDYKEVTVGYTDKPILGLGGIPTGEVQRIAVKDTAIIENGKITGYTSGRSLDAKPIADDQPSASTDTTSRFLWSRERGRYPNPDYQAPSGDQVGQGTVLKEGASAILPSANVEANRNVEAEFAALGRGARPSQNIIVEQVDPDEPYAYIPFTPEGYTPADPRQVVETAQTTVQAPPKIQGRREKTGIDAISDDAIIARYRALQRKKGRKASEDQLLKRLESILLSRGLTGAL